MATDTSVESPVLGAEPAPDMVQQACDISQADGGLRTFLVVVDKTQEMHAALRFAALRAEHSGGRTALLKVLEPVEFAHFGSINTLMEQEAREEAEAELQRHAATVQRISGRMPSLYLRKGKPIDELLKLIEEEKEHLSILVLASGTGKEGPGPLISQLAGKLNRRLRIPLTIVPGSLTDDEIDRLS